MYKLILDLLYKYKTFVKYLIAGGTAAFVDLALLFVLTHYFGLHYLWSASLAFLLAFFVSFFLQKFWTFRDSNRETMNKQMFQYLVTALINLALNSAIMFLLVSVFGLWYMLAQMIAGGTIALWSFLIYHFLIFNKKNEHEQAAN
jgi:putative flippase GtrA